MNVLAKFSLLPVEDEGRLKNSDIRRHFLTRLFSIADLREFKKNVQNIKELIYFHQRYKYLLMTYSQVKLRELGKLVANCKKDNLRELILNYSEIFLKAFLKKPSRKQYFNTLIHIFGHLSNKLKEKEKLHFLNLLEKYREGKVELKVLVELLRNWTFRFNDEYLSTQTYLKPYPEDLEV